MNSLYDYSLPEELIANKPREPRDSAKLFVFDAGRGEVSYDTFQNLADHIPAPAVIVLNETKVVPARVDLKKETGGKVGSLFLMNEWKGKGELFPVIVDKKISVGSKVFIEPSKEKYAFEVASQDENIFFLKPLFNAEDIFSILENAGKTPVPKYIKGISLKENELRDRYQTIFASVPASVAAPTASLHFTPSVLEKLKKKGVEIAKITLNVGLGTFAPVSEENVREEKLHKEAYYISDASANLIKSAKEKGEPVIAVGTTVVRALESAAKQLLTGKDEGDRGISGDTEIFIRPPYDFRIVDMLVTNFHIPKSSLMMLVQAFLTFKGSKRSLVELYEVAKKECFRFYSFGDSMLIR